MKEEEKYIQLDKSDTLKLGIRNADGEPTGEYLEFDLEDIELPLKLQNMIEKVKFIKSDLDKKLLIIEKKQDYKGKKMMSANEEAQYRAFRDAMRELEKVYNTFLGTNGVRKLLGGGNLQWTSFNKIDKIIEEQIMPHLNFKSLDIKKKIKTMFDKSKEEKSTLE